ncbi:hypothetical protein [Calothrix sp. NIES-3974]|nr:hypothetical protein [Calothrix sp. NIES-3974]
MQIISQGMIALVKSVCIQIIFGFVSLFLALVFTQIVTFVGFLRSP